MQITQRRGVRIAAVALLLSILFVLQIDDWGRDLTGHSATLSAEELSESFASLTRQMQQRTLAELTAAVRMAASRIRNWEYVGDTSDGRTVVLAFVRTHRLLRLRDDIVVRLEDRGDHRALSAESRSRLGVGDLGRNPRNLRRLLLELDAVLAGASAFPVLTPPGLPAEG
jgi:hypothetical protein